MELGIAVNDDPYRCDCSVQSIEKATLMIPALCTGSLAKDPKARMSKAGKPYVQAKVRCGGIGAEFIKDKALAYLEACAVELQSSASAEVGGGGP